nr:zinc finger BED domain-containing protein 1 [Nomia melanderi]
MAKTRAKRSAIWRYFSECSERDKNTLVKCNACNAALPFCRNTTNLWSHIRIHHRVILDNISAKKSTGERPRQSPSIYSHNIAADSNRPTIEPTQILSASCNGAQRYPADSKRAAEITNALLLMIAEDVYPFSIVNDRGFVNFVRTLDENYQLPDKNSLATKYLPALYESKCKEIAEKLSEAEYVHLSVDSWSEGNRKMSFVAITAHYCVRGVLQQSTLRVFYTLLQCGSRIYELLDQTAIAWSIRSKIKTIVYDSASNVHAAPAWRRISCFEHTLNTVVRDAIKENRTVVDVLHKCRDIVGVLKTDSVIAKASRNEKKESLLKSLNLKKDIIGRWKSTYSMLCNMVELRCILSTMHAHLLENNVAWITENEWETISGTIQLLKPFHEAAKEVSGDCRVTISKIIPIVHCIEAAVANQVNLMEDAMLLRANLLNELGMCFEGIEAHPVYSIATFLDPRYKNIAFHSNECVELVKNLLTSQYKLREGCSKDVDGYGSAVQQGRNDTDDINDTLWAEFDKKVQKATVESVYYLCPLKDELERYLLLKPINRKSNPISWWNAEGKTLFPKLMKLALEYLCIPATCVSNEQLFAKVEQILSQRRTRMQSKYLNMLSMLHLNRNN